MFWWPNPGCIYLLELGSVCSGFLTTSEFRSSLWVFWCANPVFFQIFIIKLRVKLGFSKMPGSGSNDTAWLYWAPALMIQFKMQCYCHFLFVYLLLRFFDPTITFKNLVNYLKSKYITMKSSTLEHSFLFYCLAMCSYVKTAIMHVVQYIYQSRHYM